MKCYDIFAEYHLIASALNILGKGKLEINKINKKIYSKINYVTLFSVPQ